MSKHKNTSIKLKRSKKPLWITIGVIVAIIAVLVALHQLGVPHRNLAALYVGDEKVTVAEWNYYYQQEKMNLAKSLGISPLQINPKEKANVGGELGETWGEVLDNAVTRRIQQTYVKKHEMEAIGNEFTEEEEEFIKASMQNLRMSFPNEVQFRTYLEQSYGIGVTPDLVEKVERDNLTARKFDAEYRQNIDLTDDEVAAFYEEHTEDYQVVDYHLIQVDTEETKLEAAPERDSEIDEGEDDSYVDATKASAEDRDRKDEELDGDEKGTELEDQDAAKNAENLKMKDLLERFDSKLKTTKDFTEFGKKYENRIVRFSSAVRSPAKDDRTKFEKNRGEVYPEEVRTWLFDEERVAGDITRIDVDGQAYYVLFEDIRANETLTADISYRFFPMIHPDNSPMPMDEVEQVRKIAEEYAAGIDSAEDLEKGPEAWIVPEDKLTSPTAGSEEQDTPADEADVKDETDKDEETEKTDETNKAEETDETSVDRVSEVPVGVPVTSYGPYEDQLVHSRSEPGPEVVAAALETEAGETKVVSTFNGIYVIHVKARGPLMDWEARAGQDLALQKFNDKVNFWLKEDERYQVRKDNFGRLFAD